MFTTPRKVKQESRLRRSLSLTNTSRANEDTTNLSELDAHLTETDIATRTCPPAESEFPFSSSVSDLPYNQSQTYDCNYDCNHHHHLPQHLSALSADFSSTSFGTAVFQQPPPYRAPPSASALGTNPENCVDGSNSSFYVEQVQQVQESSPDTGKTYQTHSAKFPIVKEVIFSAASCSTSTLRSPNLSINGNSGSGTAGLGHQFQNSNSRIPILTDPNNKKLSAKPGLGWAEDRKAFTLDSKSAKEFQDKFQTGSQKTITRRNSLDLEKFIQVFNEEQALLSSMQQGRHLDGGIDNPGLDLGGSQSQSQRQQQQNFHISHQHQHQEQQYTHPSNMYNCGGIASSSSKMSGYFPDSSNSTSTSSQSQSLSSSNTDSLDTVIYKGPSAQPGAGSIRDWQQRSESNPEIPLDFNHRSENNSHRDTNNHIEARAYQMPQHSYQHSPQYNGQNSYAMDYRPPQSQSQQYQQHLNQQHQQQGLSVQTLKQQQHSSYQQMLDGSISNQQIQIQNNGLPSHSNGIMRGVNGGGNINSGYVGSNPQLASKSPLMVQKQLMTSTNGGTSTDLMSLDKTKDSTKQFHTKTYNHIKDMISSRFGTVGSSSNNVANNSNHMSYNNNMSGGISGSVNMSPSNFTREQANNSSVSYPSAHNGLDGPPNFGLPNSAYGIHHHQNNTNTMSNTCNGGGQAAYYTAGPASQPQQSPNNGHGGNAGPQIQNSYGSANPNTIVNDRKNVNTSFRKAIQKSTQKSNLTDDSVQLRTIVEAQNQNQVNNNNQLHHQQPQQTQYSPVEHQHPGGNVTTGIHATRAQKALDKLVESSKPSSYTTNSNVTHSSYHLTNGDLIPNTSQIKQMTQNPPPYPENKAPPPIPPASSRLTGFSTKSPAGSLSPVKNNTTGIYSKHAHSEISQIWSHNSTMLENDQPPPLPMSQKPTMDNSTPASSLGLPSPSGLVSSVRENGDGSSGSMEATAAKCLSESVLKSDKLKQITTDLHNLALSVTSDHHQSSSSEGEIKGSQRVGSGQSHTTTDSGHGTVLLTKSPQHSGNVSEHAPLDALIGHRHKFGDNIADSLSSGNDSEWVDIVEPEIRQILELERAAKAAAGKSSSRATGSTSQSHQSQSQHLVTQCQQNQSHVTEPSASPVPHSSRQQAHTLQISPSHSPKIPKKFDLNSYNKKANQELLTEASSGQDPSTSKISSKSPRVPTSLLRSNSGSGQRSHPWNARPRLGNDKGKSATVGRKDLLLSQTKAGKLTRNAMSQILYSLHDDNGDMTSTTTGLDLESMLDGPTENTSDDDDLSTTIDTTDAHAIRRQLESLESMYTEVLKVLGAKKFAASGTRYPSSDLRNAKRRPYGSMSSLPSSVSSRPFRENKKKIDDKKKVKDIKSINRRFQRLESHVVTLARSVAHLSSEMRTQHLMVQEMESIRNELSQLRTQVMKAQNQSAAATAVATANGQNFSRGLSGGRQGGGQLVNTTDWTSFRNALPSLTNPCRVRKLTKFFGDEPPLIRIFLKKLGYEKYASHFEQERIGIMELPYLTEERLQKMGIPMGPRLRILQEAHLCLKPGSHFPSDHPIHNGHGNTGNLSVYVV